PQDYRWRSCPIECLVVDREIVELGGFSVQAVTTPGHSADHVSWLVRRGARTWLVAGDALFHGGRIVLQHIYDCDIAAYARSLRALAELEFDALLPGHGAFSLHHAVRHAKAATDWLDRLL